MAEALEAQYRRGLESVRKKGLDTPRVEADKSNDFNTQKEKESAWMRRMDTARRSARFAESALKLSGYQDLAGVFGNIGDIAESGEEGAEDGGPGLVRKFGSNKAGSKASSIAKNRGMGGNKAAAVGGAVSSALQGEGAVGIAKGAGSWVLLEVAFKALFTLIGFIPALLYLNFHYIMSKFGSKIFGEMFFSQKIILLLANILVCVALLIILLWISVMARVYTEPWEVIKLFGSIIVQVFWGLFTNWLYFW